MPHFDPDQPDHVMGLAVMIDGILNSTSEGVRFALVVWQDDRCDVQGLISNDLDDNNVIVMLDDAKKQITATDGLIHQITPGHA